MKHKLLAALVLTGFGTSAFAQVTPSLPPGVGVVQEAPAPMLGQANTFERETTPLLREISRKKAILELKRLDREIEKLEEEALKAQIERETSLMNASRGGMGPMGGMIQGGMFNPSPLNQAPTLPLPTSLTGEAAAQEMAIKVLMIYGFENNLMAKIAAGQQGGYVVKKGDVLPNGELVFDVKPNYIEVGAIKDKNATKRESRRIFVSTLTAPSGSSNQQGDQSGGNQGSSNLMPALTTIPAVGAIQTR